MIPEVFLRGADVPEPFITNMKALVAAMSPIEFYSCFISYSTKDQEFADRLHADLQSKGVRCWLASEDLKTGDRFRDRIDESIPVHDKLLLVLSEHSVKSPWVRTEVESAFEREHQQDISTVLFQSASMIPSWILHRRGRPTSGARDRSARSLAGRITIRTGNHSSACCAT